MMTQQLLTAEDLLAGASATYDIAIPPHILRPGARESDSAEATVVQLRPITIGSMQLILKAAREDPGQIPLLMIKESLETPQMSLVQISKMHLGLVEFLISHIREISGLTEKKSP